MTRRGGDEEISDVTLAAARRARQRAQAEMPTPEALAGMTLGAAGADMTPAQIRRLASIAIEQAQQISFLLGKLAALLDEEQGGPR